MKLKKLIFLLFIFFMLNEVDAQSMYSVAFDSLLHQYSKEHSIVGLSIGVVHKNSSYTRSFGHTSFNSGHPITDSTSFNIASISKLFTATAVMQLIEKNQLNLDTKLIDVIPNFKMRDKRYRDITIEHLLRHSSGLPWDNPLKNSPDNKTSIPLYIKNLEKRKLNFKPGSKIAYETYSNIAFDLLGIVVERISGQSFVDYVELNILHKIGMMNSTFLFEDIDSAHLALPQIIAGDSKDISRLNFQGVDRKRNPILNQQPLTLKTHTAIGENYEHNPSGNLMSSSIELNLWMKEILDISNNAPNKIIQPKSLQGMWDGKKILKQEKISIGLGWWIKEDEKLGKGYFHVGTNPGYCSILILYPKHNLGISILCNGWYAKDVIWKDLLDDVPNLFIEAESRNN